MKKYLPTFVAVLYTLLLASVVYSQDDPTVYVTRTGSKYHTAGCSYLRESAIPMKLSEAVGRYSPCSRCNPQTSLAKAQENSHPIKEKVAPSAKSSTLDKSTMPQHGSKKGVGTTPRGNAIYEGPRGGRYHYSKSGKKVYEEKKY